LIPRRSIVVIGLALVFMAGACGNARVEGTAGRLIKTLPAEMVPSELLGLPVTQENMSASLSTQKDAFVEAVGLYAMRRADLVQATLQVSRFRSNAPIDKASFRTSVVSQIGGRRSQQFRMGSSTVYRTTGRKQVISLWFRDHYLFVLSVRDTFDQPRSLLRETLKVTP
jgi:hypothetical protein